MILNKQFMDKINERAAGRLRIDFTGSTEVIPANDMIGALSKGIVDLVNVADYHKDSVPEVYAIEVVSIGLDKERIPGGFYDFITQVHKQKLGVIPLLRLGYNAPFFIYTNAEIKTLNDFKGLKFRSNSSYDTMFTALGATRVSMAATDIYNALQTKLIIGYANPRYISRYALGEITKYRIDDPFWNGSPNYLYINQKLFEGFPADLQKILVDTSIEVEKNIPAIQGPMDANEDKIDFAAGMKPVKLATPEEDKKLVDLANNVIWDTIAAKAGKDTVTKIQNLPGMK